MSSAAARSRKARAKWDATMAESGLQLKTGRRGKAAKKRTSGRTVVVSKALRVVDEETRRQVRDARLNALEADNYVDESMEGDPDEDLYMEEEEEESKRGRKRPRRKKETATKTKDGRKRKVRKVKSLAQVIFDARYDPSGDSGPNYVTAAAKSSGYPARKFCSVCGYISSYACSRCGSRYCCTRCYDHHTETRCLKFGM